MRLPLLLTLVLAISGCATPKIHPGPASIKRGYTFIDGRYLRPNQAAEYYKTHGVSEASDLVLAAQAHKKASFLWPVGILGAFVVAGGVSGSIADQGQNTTYGGAALGYMVLGFGAGALIGIPSFLVLRQKARSKIRQAVDLFNTRVTVKNPENLEPR